MDAQQRKRAPVALLTGRYSTFNPANGVPVGITVGRPRFPLSYRLAATIDELAPFGLLYQHLKTEEFDQRYVRQLHRTGVAVIHDRLEEIAERHGGPLVLLCFEDVHADQHCHRRTFARWWTERTGQPVPEAEAAQLTFDQGSR